MFNAIAKVGAVLFCSAIIGASVFFYVQNANKNAENILEEVVIEAGSQIEIADFFSECPEDAVFVTDISGIDTNEPAVYQLKVSYDKVFEKDVILRIEDHTAPTGAAVPQSVYSNWKMPDAKSCVKDLYDLSGIAATEYQDGTPKFTKTGEFDVPVKVTDTYGNSTVIMVPFSVIHDNKAPVIKGVHDFEVGDDPHDLDFFSGITVTDNYDDKPVLKVDDSRVNYSKSGIYTIIYSAIDKAGNIGTSKVKITVTIPGDDEENPVEEEDLDALYYYYTNHADESYGLAENILSGLWGSNDVETARAIFEWVHSNISYVTINYYQSYEAAAFRGFSSRTGDCYVYCCCCKMLLDQAGIPNMTVTRYPVIGNGHYWNLVKLNGEWYHCDATRFMYHPEIFFMCTDDEIDDSRHQYDGYQYPKRAGGSTQYSNSAPSSTQKNTSSSTPAPKPTSTPKVTATPTPVPKTTSAPEPTVSPTPVPTDTPVPTPTEAPEPMEEPQPVPTDEPEPTPADDPVTVPTEKPEPSFEEEPVRPSSGRPDMNDTDAGL